jgi:chemotaxis protein CheY-P-specific phosphatase CheC
LDQRAIVDVVCKSGMENLAGEIAVLLGQELTCSDVQLNLTTREDLFSDLSRKKTALTRMSVEGDLEGDCYLLAEISSAAILGGTLIMLPEDAIEDNAQSEKLEGEIDDAFGEVANIIAGVFTQAFVDKYAKNLRFIKRTVEELIPTKIDPISIDQPFPAGNYHVTSCNMKMGDRDLGPLELVVPTAILELEETIDKTDTPAEAEAPTAEKTPEASPEEKSVPEPEPVVATSSPEPAQEPAPAVEKKPPFADAKKIVDVVFNAIIGQVGEEIGALLGQSLKCDDIQLIMTSKADFFSNHCIEKSVMTNMKVTGDREGLGFMIVQVPDAIALGGTLIMLPEDQIAEQKRTGQFDGDVEDAYGEVANILSGSLTQVFLERYPKKLHFVKTEAETIVPTKIDPSSDQPFPDSDYYLASFAIEMEGHELNRILLIFPAEIFDLEQQPAAETAQEPAPAAKQTAAQAGSAAGTNPDEPAPGEWGGPPISEGANVEPAPGEWGGGPTTTEGASVEPAVASSEASTTTSTEGGAQTTSSQPAAEPAGPPIVLLIGDQKTDADPFVEILSSAQYECRVLTFQEEVKGLFQQHKILGIFLIMEQIGEKGFAAAIKLQSAGQPLPPIIFAGSEWTRSAVLRAVKYGAKDILVMPASGDEIQDKVAKHFKKAS